jgi:hypothetical protein
MRREVLIVLSIEKGGLQRHLMRREVLSLLSNEMRRVIFNVLSNREGGFRVLKDLLTYQARDNLFHQCPSG